MPHTDFVWENNVAAERLKGFSGEVNLPLTRGLLGCPSALKRRGPIFSDSPPVSDTKDRKGRIRGKETRGMKG